MSFAEFGGVRGAQIPEHNRLRGLESGNPHPQYQLAGGYAADDHGHAAHAADTPMAGSAGTDLLFEGGSVGITTDGSGNATLTFPTAFATGVLTANVQCFSNSIIGVAITITAASVSALTLNVRDLNNANLASTSFNVVWQAWGY